MLNARHVVVLLCVLSSLGCWHVASAHNTCASAGITVTTTVIDGDVAERDVVLLKGPSGAVGEIVFARTNNRTLYVSYDYGANWVSTAPLLVNVSSFNPNSTTYWPAGGVLSIFANSDKTRVYIVGVNGRYWTTTNGVDFVAYKYSEPHRGEGTYFDWFEPNPGYPNNVVAVVATECIYHGNISCDTGRWDVIISNDAGATWTTYDTFVTFRMYNRGEYWMYIVRNYPSSIFVDKDTMWYLAFEIRDPYGGNYGNQKAAWDVYLGATAQVSDAPRLYIANTVTAAVKSTPIKARSNVGQASYDGSFFWVIEDFNVNVPGSRGTSRFDLFLSNDKGQNWATAEIPPPPELDFVPRTGRSITTFFSFPEDRNFFLSIYTDFTTAAGFDFNGDLWVNTGASAGQFTWSLNNVYPGLLYDVKSSANVMIANHYVGRTGFGVQTVISFNKGGSWQLIPAPIPNTYACNSQTQKCFLHLGLRTDSIHSEPAAPGFIIANGNIGEFYNEAQQSVFTSYDGGRTWSQVTGGEFDESEPPSLYDIAVDGSIFLSVPVAANTSLISYSSTGNNAWTHCELADSVSVRTLLSVVSSQHNGALLFSSTGSSSIKTISHIDFDPIFARNCTDDDYDLWSSASPTAGCVLGRNTTYYRIKPGVSCMNAVKAGTVASSEPCPCGPNDFVCAQCFFWNSTSSQCEFSAVCPETTNLPTRPPDGCFAPSTFEAPYTGYQKLSGSQCISSDYDPTIGPRTLRCPTRLLATQPIAAPQTDNSEVRRLSPNDVAGIVVGVVIAILLVLLIIFGVIAIRRRLQGDNNSAQRLPEPEEGVNL